MFALSTVFIYEYECLLQFTRVGVAMLMNNKHKYALSLLQNCTSFRQLRQIHGKMIRYDLLSPESDRQQVLLRKLIHLSSSFAQLDYATLIIHHSRHPLTFTWNLLITAFTCYGFPHRALLLFRLMLSRSHPPDKFTFPFLIKACSADAASLFPWAQLLHALSIKSGFSSDVFLQNTLIHFYFKCGHTHSARALFHNMPLRNVVSWTTMLRGLLHTGDLHTASFIFDTMPARNVVSWTVMIDGHVKNQQHKEAFELFTRMQEGNVEPNGYTLVSLVRACTELGSLGLGRWVHEFSLKKGIPLEVILGTALVDMYSKCGSLKEARRVFDTMQRKSLATWNSMITSLGVHGFGEEALCVFAEMEEANVKPDAITFVGVLCACLQTNNINDASYYFDRMIQHYKISPIQQHYASMIEMYSRAAMLSEAATLVKQSVATDSVSPN